MASAGRLYVGGLVARPGPFDKPPDEATLLAPDLPWELREDDDPDPETEAKNPGTAAD